MKTISATATATPPIQHNQYEYEEKFLGGIQKRFSKRFGSFVTYPLFTTSATGLFDAFLDGFPDAETRQHYNCNACRSFVNKYGGIVTVLNGEIIPVMWNTNHSSFSELYEKSINNLIHLIKESKITGVFLSSEKVWGKPVTGEWHHMAISNPPVFSHKIKSSGQMMAEKKQDFITLVNSLTEFPIAAIEQALRVLRSDSLYQSEKVLGVAEWLMDLHQKRDRAKDNRTKRNLTWLAVATAPPGFCHVKSTMIGTLLTDIVKGYPFDDISRRWASKMKPDQYQRPQVAPSTGNITQAEVIFKKMGLEESLRRRFARLDEIELLWRPLPQGKEPIPAWNLDGNVFSHLKPKNSPTAIKKLELPPITITWKKFFDTVLPTARTIEFYVPYRPQGYTALVTAADFDAPPILQWDSESRRNPVSTYTYMDYTHPNQWNLKADTYCKVSGICLSPQAWHGDFSHQGNSVVFILDGAVDINGESCGNALFPAILKSELHGIRATIEAYSKGAVLSGIDEASACGIGLSKSIDWDGLFRVHTGNGNGDSVDYKIDRWD